MSSRLPGGRRGSARNQSGAAAVEFALVAMPFIALMLGTIQLAWYFFGAQSATAAAREGARQIVVGQCWGASFEPFVMDQSFLITSASYVPADLSTADIGDVVTVTVEADAGVIGFLPLVPDEATRIFEARLEDQAPGDGTCS